MSTLSSELFKERFSLLIAYFGVRLDIDTIRLYWSLLKFLSFEEFHRACNGLIAEWTPRGKQQFPLISDFLRMCGRSMQDRSRTAIMAIKTASARVGQHESVSFADEAIHRVVEGYGGWPSVSRWSDVEWDVNEGRLHDSLVAAFRGGLTGMSHLPGINEKAAGYFRVKFYSPAVQRIVHEIKFVGVPDEQQILQVNNQFLLVDYYGQESAKVEQLSTGVPV